MFVPRVSLQLGAILLFTAVVHAADKKFVFMQPGDLGFSSLPQEYKLNGKKPFKRPLYRDEIFSSNRSSKDKVLHRMTEDWLAAPSKTLVEALFRFEEDGRVEYWSAVRISNVWRRELKDELKKPKLKNYAKYSPYFQSKNRIYVLENILIPGAMELRDLYWRVDISLEQKVTRGLELSQLLSEVHYQTRNAVEDVRNSYDPWVMGRLQSQVLWDFEPDSKMPALRFDTTPINSNENPSDSGFWMNTDVGEFNVAPLAEEIFKLSQADLYFCGTQKVCPEGVPSGALILDPKKWTLGKEIPKTNGGSQGYKIAAVKIKWNNEKTKKTLDLKEGQPDFKKLMKVKSSDTESFAEALAAPLVAALGYNSDPGVYAPQGIFVNTALPEESPKFLELPRGYVKPDLKKIESIGFWSPGVMMDHHMRREVRALRIVHSYFQNWDLKDSQQKLYYDESSKKLIFGLNDLGSSFGQFKLKLGWPPFIHIKGTLCAIRTNEAITTTDRKGNWKYRDGFETHTHLPMIHYDYDSFRYLTYDDAKWIVTRIALLKRSQYEAVAKRFNIDQYLSFYQENTMLGANEEFVHRMLCRRDRFAEAFNVSLPEGEQKEQGCDEPTKWAQTMCTAR